jgi:uncharacterized protein (DUF1015 family)
MDEYLSRVLVSHPDSMIYTERVQSDGETRRGIVMAIDLECYDYKKGAASLIRATEATVVERIPPRVAIRRGAALELPHVMLLIDDAQRCVIEPLSRLDKKNIAYDFELMLGGGRIKGVFLDESARAEVERALMSLVTPENIKKKYGDEALAPLMFAVGDGNHSLASAKAMYEEIKSELGENAVNHPARYALVEVVNIHDEALKFEPIYRIVTDADTDDLLRSLSEYAKGLSGDAPAQICEYITADSCGKIVFEHPHQQLTVGTLQIFLDKYLAEHKGVGIDYIHGESSVASLANQKNSIGFIFDGMEKDQLFKTVIFDGALPRKTFSMGHANDKRFYLECRKIKK